MLKSPFNPADSLAIAENKGEKDEEKRVITVASKSFTIELR